MGRRAGRQADKYAGKVEAATNVEASTSGSFKQKSKALKNTFNPEFLNRLDDIITFNSLDKKSLKKIVKLELESLRSRLLEKNYIFNFKVLHSLPYPSYDNSSTVIRKISL